MSMESPEKRVPTTHQKSYVRLVKGTNFPAPLFSPGGRTARKDVQCKSSRLNVAHRWVEITVAGCPPCSIAWMALGN